MAKTIKTVSRLEFEGFAEAKRQIGELIRAKKSFQAPARARLVPAGAEAQVKRLVQAKKEFEKPWRAPKVAGLDKLRKASNLKFEASGIRKVETGIKRLLKLKKEYERPVRNPFGGGGRGGVPRGTSRGGAGNLSGQMAAVAAVAPKSISGVLGYAGAVARVAGPVALAAAATAGLTLGLVKVVDTTSRAADQVRGWRQTLEFATGSQEGANNQLLFASDLARELGADVRTLTGEYSRFAAATKDTVLEGQQADQLFSSIARGVQIMGGNADKAFLALTQMASKPRLSLEELQQQLAEALPGSVQIFADAVGMTRGEFVNLVAQGKVMSADVLPKVAAQMQKTFGNVELPMTYGRGINNINNAIFDLSASIGTDLSPVVGELLTQFADVLTASAPFVKFWAGEAVTAAKSFGHLLSQIWDVLSMFPNVLSIAHSSFVSFSEGFAKIGGLTGLSHQFSAAVLEASGHTVKFASTMTEFFMGTIQKAVDMLKTFLAKFQDAPGVGKFAKELTGNLDKVSKAIDTAGKKAGKTLGEIEQDLKDAAKVSLEKAMDATTRGIEKAGTATRGLDKDVGGFKKTVEDTHPAVKALVDDLALYEEAGKLMRDFGLDSDQAMKAAKLLATEGVKKTRTEVVALVKELDIARDEFEENAAAVKAYSDAVAELDRIQRVTDAVREFGIDAQTASEAVKLATDANMDLAAAIELVQSKQLAQGVLEFEAAGGFFAVSDEDIARMTAGMDLWETGKTRIEQYRKELKRLKADLDNKQITQEQFNNAKASLDGQMEGWEILGAKIADVAEESGGVWGRVLGAIGENLDKVGAALGEAANVAFQQGDRTTGFLMQAAQAGVAGDYSGLAMNAVAATGFGQQKISQFGGRGEGNFVQEGMAIGSAFGPWGTLIGGVVGAFVKKGADDFHSHMTEVSGKASLVITQAEGDLDKVGEQIKSTVDGMLNSIQGMVGDDLNFALKGFEIHIRNDDVRVVANGIERTFNDLDMAIDFFIHGMIDAQEELAGLGPNMQAAFNQISSTSTATGDPEALMRALAVASAMDFEETGVRQDLISARREELRLIRDFGIPLESYLEFKNKELEIYKRSLIAQASGIQDWAGNIAALSKELNSVNNTVNASREIDLKRKAELEALLAAQEASNVALVQGTTGLSEQTQALQQQTGMTQEQAQQYEYFSQQAQNASNAGFNYANTTGLVTSTYTGGLLAAQQFGLAMMEETDARNEGAVAALQYRAELDLINASLDSLPEGFDPEEIQRTLDAQFAGAATQIGTMIMNFAERGLIDLSADERIELRRQLFELERVAAITQIHATQAQIQAMLALGTVSANVAGILEAFLANIPNYLDQIVNAGFDAGDSGSGGRSGGGRHKQRLEERRRAAEEAAQKLDEFNTHLRTLELNASTASRSLGDLANQIEDIGRRAKEALAAGAAPEDVRRMQQLELRGLRRNVTDPFTSFGRDSFRDQSVDIEQQRRAAIEAAKLVAQAQADALGIPFEVAFASMESEINAGAKRMKRALTQGLIESFGLPLENVRKQGRDFKKQMDDLEQAYKSGSITHRRYKQLVKQIQAAQTAALQSDLLGMLDKYYDEVEGREELRREMEIASFNLQLAMLQLRLNTLIAEGAITAENAAQAQGFLDWMTANPPNWDEWFADGPSGGGGAGAFSGSSFSSVGQGTTAGTGINLDSLIAAINNFIDGFEAIDMGQFERMAHEFLTSISGFQTDLENELGTVLSTGFTLQGHAVKTAQNFLRRQTGDMTLQISGLADLTEEQLEMLAGADLSGVSGFQQGVEDVFEALLAIQNAEELKPEAIRNVLSAYKKLPEETSQLAAEFRQINSEFADVQTALEMLGASEEELFEARQEHIRQLLEFEKKALADIRSVGEDIRGGQVFGNATARQRVGIAERNLAQLRARLAADPTDFEALEQLGPAMREVLEARRELTGGVGPAFTLALKRIEELSDTFDLDMTEAASASEMALAVAEDHLTVTREQTDILYAAQQDTMTTMASGFLQSSTAFSDGATFMSDTLSGRLDMARLATVDLGSTLQPAINDAKNSARYDMERQRAIAEQQLSLTAQANFILERLDVHMANMVELASATGSVPFQVTN